MADINKVSVSIEENKDTVNQSDVVVDNTKEKADENLTIKARVLGELKKPGFPDLKFLYSDEVLNIAPQILEELLEEEKCNFKKILETKGNDITFEIFEDIEELEYFWSLLNHLKMVNKTNKLEKIIENFEPKIISFENEKLFSKDYYDLHVKCLEKGNLNSDENKILEESIKEFRLNGVDLNNEDKVKLNEINTKLAELSNKFYYNEIDSKEEYKFVIEDLETIKNLPEETLKQASELADKEGKKGYVFTSSHSDFVDLMTFCSDAGTRKKIYKDSVSFASSGKYDNRPLILEILNLEKQKSNLLGYKNFAEYSMQRKMADSPEQIFELIGGISKKAKQKTLKEFQEIKDYFDIDQITPWDVKFYYNKLKEEKYSINEKELRKYFEYENVVNYMFELVGKLYGLEFKEIKASVYAEDVKVYDVYKDGKLISYFLLDPFYKPKKAHEAWANQMRGRSNISGIKKVPFVLNVLNYKKVENGPTLLTKKDAEVLFHEFGHGLHAMLSESEYSELSGFEVEWDFVELPSQIHEKWVKDKDSLKLLAKHCETGETISDDLLDKLEEIKTFDTGYSTLRQNEFALLDMHLYTSDIPKTVEELDKKVIDYINQIGVFKRGEYDKFYATFSHIFGGGYGTGYYGYMWADILVSDISKRIDEMGKFERTTGEFFNGTLLGQGARKSGADMFKDFMGRGPDIEAFNKEYRLG